MHKAIFCVLCLWLWPSYGNEQGFSSRVQPLLIFMVIVALRICVLPLHTACLFSLSGVYQFTTTATFEEACDCQMLSLAMFILAYMRMCIRNKCACCGHIPLGDKTREVRTNCRYLPISLCRWQRIWDQGIQSWRVCVTVGRYIIHHKYTLSYPWSLLVSSPDVHSRKYVWEQLIRFWY